MSTEKSNGGPFVTFREECEILRARVAELEAQLAEAKSKQVSGFFHDEVPTFQQGEPNHEVLELITAKDCTGYVEKIVELRERLSEKDKLLLLAKDALDSCGYADDSMKDELINDACTAIAFYGEQPPQSLFDALSMPCDDSTLKAWLGEPIGEVKKHTGSLKDMAIIVWSGEQPAEGTKLYSPKGLK